MTDMLQGLGQVPATPTLELSRARRPCSPVRLTPELTPRVGRRTKSPIRDYSSRSFPAVRATRHGREVPAGAGLAPAEAEVPGIRFQRLQPQVPDQRMASAARLQGRVLCEEGAGQQHCIGQ